MPAENKTPKSAATVAPRTTRVTVVLNQSDAERLAAFVAGSGVGPSVGARLALLAGLGLLEGEQRQTDELAEAQAAILAAIEKTDAAMRAGVGAVYKAVRGPTPGAAPTGGQPTPAAVPGQR